MISPASGRVMGITEGGDRTVSIFMQLYNSHITVAPLDGVVRRIIPERGKFKPAFMRSSDFNTRNTIELATEYGTVRVVQIAGFFTRKIICQVQEGQKIRKGEQMGKICFGSRVDVSIPEDFELCVSGGTRVRCRKTVIAILQ